MDKAMRTAISLGIGIAGGYALYRVASKVLGAVPNSYIFTISISIPLVIYTLGNKEEGV